LKTRHGAFIGPVGLVLASCALAASRWLQFATFWSDPPRWLFEAYRLSQGETIYRDFAHQYPPLAPTLYALWFRIFGATFPAIQWLVLGLSIGLVLSVYALACEFLSRRLAFLTSLLFIVVGSDFNGFIGLFSIRSNSPGVIVGATGLCWFLWAVVRLVRGTKGTKLDLTLAAGAWVGLLAKPEFGMAVVLVLGALTLANFRMRLQTGRQLASAWLVTLAPAMISYAVIAKVVGRENLAESLTGYGMAGIACPWWPTGLALTMAAGASLAALAAAFGFHRLCSPMERIELARWPWMGTLALVASLTVVCVYLFDIEGWRTSYLLFGSSVWLLLPALWGAVIVFVGCTLRMARGSVVPAEIYLAVAAVTGLGARSALGNLTDSASTVAPVAYPFLLIAAPAMLVWSAGGRYGAKAAEHAMTGVLLLLLATKGVGGLAYHEMPGLREYSYKEIVTRAGPVKLYDPESIALYRLIESRTKEGDYVLDLNGGGINFAARLRSPIFSTQFYFLKPTEEKMRADLAGFVAHPPRFVIADNKPGYHVYYGSPNNVGCTFPRLVWRSDRPGYELGKTFPVIEAIKRSYRVESATERHVIMVPR
jgi:hypothetical protein